MMKFLTNSCALLITILIAGTAMAQAPYALPDYSGKQLTKEISPAALQQLQESRAERLADANTRDDHGQWISFIDAVEAAGSAPRLVTALLWPDSLPVIEDADGNFHWFIHALTQHTDPNSILLDGLYGTSGVGFSNGNQYDVDSMAFYYLYERVSAPSVIDTLRIYIYGENNINEQTFNDWPSAGESTDVAWAEYSNANFRPATSIIEQYEILLGPADTSTAFIALQVLALDHRLSANRKIGAAFHYVPGQTATLGEVLFSNVTLGPGTLNNFDLITFEEDEDQFPISTVTDEGALNGGGIVETEIRYGLNSLGWNIAYYPTMGFTAPWVSEHVLNDWYMSPLGASFVWGTTANACEIQFGDQSNVDPTDWFWTFGDGSISFDENPVYTYPENNVYSVSLEVTDPSGTEFTTSQNVVVANCGGVGVEDLASLVSFQIFPNPASERVTFDVNLNGSQDLEVSIFDIAGRLVFSEQVQNIDAYTRTIGVGDFPAGVYELKLQNGRQVASKSFIIE